MPSRPLPAQTPAALLRAAKPLKSLLSQAQRLAHLQRLLESQLQPAARGSCHVASWHEGRLLLIVTDSQWATRLRYQQRQLQRQLQSLDAFEGLSKILFKVKPAIPTGNLPGRTPELSPAAASSIRSAAEGIDDPKLRRALERLAQNSA